MHVIGTIARRDIGILPIKQNVVLALKQASHADVLENAEIAFEGPAAELVHDDRIRRA